MLTLCSKRLKVLLICVISVLGMQLLTFMILRHHARETVVLRDEFCKLSQTWRLSFVDTEPNRTDWSFNKRVKCPELIYLQCKSNSTINVLHRNIQMAAVFLKFHLETHVLLTQSTFVAMTHLKSRTLHTMCGMVANQ